MRVIARCVHGLEWVCAEEVSRSLPDAHDVAMGRRDVTFSIPALTSELFGLRTVDDVFAEVGRVGGVGTVKAALPSLARGLSELPWGDVAEQIGQLRPIADLPLIDVVASIEGRRSYNRFTVEQVAGEVVSASLAGQYLRRTADGRASGEPDLTVRLFLRADAVIAAMRAGLVPSHRRAYKQDTGPGTLHPPAAAAMARLAGLAGLAGLKPDAVVLDPFCGDGTIAIETALTYPGARVFGRDADDGRVTNSTRNAARAGAVIEVDRADAGSLVFADADAVITNPPWNLAVDAAGSLAGSLDGFWRGVPDLLRPDGRLVVLGDAMLDLPKTLREKQFGIGLEAGLRLAGRVCHVVLAAPPGAPVPRFGDDAMRWRERALASGVVTASGL